MTAINGEFGAIQTHDRLEPDVNETERRARVLACLTEIKNLFDGIQRAGRNHDNAIFGQTENTANNCVIQLGHLLSQIKNAPTASEFTRDINVLDNNGNIATGETASQDTANSFCERINDAAREAGLSAIVRAEAVDMQLKDRIPKDVKTSRWIIRIHIDIAGKSSLVDVPSQVPVTGAVGETEDAGHSHPIAMSAGVDASSAATKKLGPPTVFESSKTPTPSVSVAVPELGARPVVDVPVDPVVVVADSAPGLVAESANVAADAQDRVAKSEQVNLNTLSFGEALAKIKTTEGDGKDKLEKLIAWLEAHADEKYKHGSENTWQKMIPPLRQILDGRVPRWLAITGENGMRFAVFEILDSSGDLLDMVSRSGESMAELIDSLAGTVAPFAVTESTPQNERHLRSRLVLRILLHRMIIDRSAPVSEKSKLTWQNIINRLGLMIAQNNYQAKLLPEELRAIVSICNEKIAPQDRRTLSDEFRKEYRVL